MNGIARECYGQSVLTDTLWLVLNERVLLCGCCVPWHALQPLDPSPPSLACTTPRHVVTSPPTTDAVPLVPPSLPLGPPRHLFPANNGYAGTLNAPQIPYEVLVVQEGDLFAHRSSIDRLVSSPLYPLPSRDFDREHIWRYGGRL